MSTLKLKSLAITATATAAPLSATDKWCSGFTVQNIDAANEVWIGDSSVASSDGFQIPKDGALGMDSLVAPSEKARQINLKDVYVVCSGGETATLRVAYVVELYS